MCVAIGLVNSILTRHESGVDAAVHEKLLPTLTIRKRARLPYGKREEYIRRVRELDLERLAGLVRVCGFRCRQRCSARAGLDNPQDCDSDRTFFCIPV